MGPILSLVYFKSSSNFKLFHAERAEFDIVIATNFKHSDGDITCILLQ